MSHVPTKTVERLQYLGLSAAYVALYVFLDRVGYIEAPMNLGITAWSPESGLTLAFLLIFGSKSALWTGVGALISEVLVHKNPASLGLIIAMSIWIAVGYGAQAWTLRRLGIQRSIAAPSDAVKLMAVALFGTLLVAAGYVTVLMGAGVLPSSSAAQYIGLYFVGDFNGILALTPLILAARDWRHSFVELTTHRIEFLGQIGLGVVLVWSVSVYLAPSERSFFFLLFIPVLWAAMRTGLAGALLTVLVTQIGLASLVHGSRAHTPFLDLQSFVLTLSGAALVLGSTVAARQRALLRLSVSEGQQRQLLAAAPDAVLLASPSGRIKVANKAAERIFGTVPVNGSSTLQQLLPDLELSEPQGSGASSGVRIGDRLFPAEVAWTWLHAPADPGVLLIVRDVTDRHRAEAQLRHQEEALRKATRQVIVGEVATALAHEINQPLTALTAYVQSLQILATQPDSGELLASTIDKTRLELQRATNSLGRLQDVYRAGSPVALPIDAAALCARTVNAIQSRCRDLGVNCELKFQARIPEALGDPVYIEIALHNLLSNAIDAVERLETTRNIHVVVRSGSSRLMIRVEDSGAGVSCEHRARIFEPGTSTKTDGMGLGLSLSRSLMRAQGGDVVLCQPEALSGACFTIEIPLVTNLP